MFLWHDWALLGLQKWKNLKLSKLVLEFNFFHFQDMGGIDQSVENIRPLSGKQAEKA